MFGVKDSYTKVYYKNTNKTKSELIWSDHLSKKGRYLRVLDTVYIIWQHNLKEEKLRFPKYLSVICSHYALVRK